MTKSLKKRKAPPIVLAAPAVASSSSGPPPGEHVCPVPDCEAIVHPRNLPGHCRKAHPRYPFNTSHFSDPKISLCPICFGPFATHAGMVNHQRLHNADFTSDLREKFRLLHALPNRHRPLLPQLASAFSRTADRLATNYTLNPSAENLFHILALPKIGMPLHAGISLDATLTRLAQYPQVPWPDPPDKPVTLSTQSQAEQVSRLCSSGKLSTAARVLLDDTPPLEMTEDVIERLRCLHPQADANGFRTRMPEIKESPDPISSEAVESAMASFRSYTAAGPSGWSVPLLRLVYRTTAFKTFLTVLCNEVLEGTAPGGDFLRSSRLIALPKDSGAGIRPIAIGEVIYRVIAKTIVRHIFRSNCLLPNQFGVNNKGGVEPIHQAVRMAMDGTLGDDLKFLCSLDWRNAFNALLRRLIDVGVLQHLPALYKAARWAYATPSDLILPCPSQEILSSSEGVRQGDPLSSLLFSLGVRPLLSALIDFLGPDYTVLAYLDDWIILSKHGDAMEKVAEFLKSYDCPLQLNTDKCRECSFDDISQNGFELLGTCLGPETARRSFLDRLVSTEERRLQRLAILDHQTALLLLRFCLQQDLRHLQRSLASDDLLDVWRRLDAAILAQHDRMQGGVVGDIPRSAGLKLIPTLPTKLGGMGLLSHSAVSRFAFAAAKDLSLNTLAGKSFLPPDRAPSTFASQHDR